MKKTKILCTIGPASIDVEVMKKMIDKGMNGIRINTAHGDFPQYETMINNLRSIKELPIVLDIKGPEIRVKSDKDYELNEGDVIPAGFDKNSNIYFSYDFFEEIKINDKVLLNEGLLEFRIDKKEKDEHKVYLKAVTSGVLKDSKSTNIPDVELKIPLLSEKDRKAIEFAKENDIEYIALSFVRTKQDILDVKQLLNPDMQIIAKIESKQGLKNFNEILEVADGIMVARGDLGVEIEDEKLPILQKEMIKKCNQAGKLVIVATQMLESMITNPRATRAETSDVANAVLDGADTLMLSGETAVGKYPVNAIKEMAEACKEAEPFVKSNIDLKTCFGISEELSKSVYHLAHDTGFVDKIITFTRSGYTTKLVSRFRTNKEIIAIVTSPKLKRQFELYYAITPILFDAPKHYQIINTAKFLFDNKFIGIDDTLLFVAGLYTPEQQVSNTLQVHKVKDLLTYEK